MSELNVGDYIVYRHTFPNNKIYIGITKQNVNKRWGNGKHYKNQVVGRAIKKYGWNNIKHEIIYNGLSENEALKIEQDLIKKYKSNQKEYGYNKTIGGEIGRKNTYMSSKATAFINNHNIDKKIKDYWKFICEDELEAQVFNNAFYFVNKYAKKIEKTGHSMEWRIITDAINEYLFAWKNNYKLECAMYNSLYVLSNYEEITYNLIFEKENKWRKTELI